MLEQYNNTVGPKQLTTLKVGLNNKNSHLNKIEIMEILHNTHDIFPESYSSNNATTTP
jgi:hypothetical protein